MHVTGFVSRTLRFSLKLFYEVQYPSCMTIRGWWAQLKTILNLVGLCKLRVFGRGQILHGFIRQGLVGNQRANFALERMGDVMCSYFFFVLDVRLGCVHYNKL